MDGTSEVLKSSVEKVAEKVDLIVDDKSRAINIVRGMIAFGQVKPWLQFIKTTCDRDVSLSDIFYPDSRVNTQLGSLIDQIVS